MIVCVTGWGGYIGPVIVRRLKEAGHYVVGLDTGWFLANWAEQGEYPDRAVFADLRDPFDVGAADAFVHLAGLSNDPLSMLDPALTDRINRAGTMALIARHPRAYHLVVSSCSVYGQNSEVATEETPLRPLTPYAKAKALVDLWLQSNDLGIEWASLRLGTVYGWSPGIRLDLVVNAFVREAVTRGIVEPQSNASRPLTHVEDVADAVAFALDNRLRGVHNVVGENRRVRELARIVARKTGASIALRPDATDNRDYKASGAKLAAAGWSPKRTVGMTVPDLATRIKTLPPGEYRRLDTVKRLIDIGYLDTQLRHRSAA